MTATASRRDLIEKFRKSSSSKSSSAVSSGFARSSLTSSIGGAALAQNNAGRFNPGSFLQQQHIPSSESSLFVARTMGSEVVYNLKFTSSRAEASKFANIFKCKLAAACSDSCCQQNNCCTHCRVDFRDDAIAVSKIYNLYFVVYGMDFVQPIAPLLPTAFTQWIATSSDGSATISTGVTVPTVTAGEALVQFNGGMGFGTSTRSGDLVVFNNIPDSASVPASTKAHLLNTLWIVVSNTAPGTWRLKPLNIGYFNRNDLLRIAHYASSSMGQITDPEALGPRIVQFTTVNCVDQTFAWETTIFNDITLVQPVRIRCIREAQNPCDSCCKSGCTRPTRGCRQCGKNEAVIGMDHGFDPLQAIREYVSAKDAVTKKSGRSVDKTTNSMSKKETLAVLKSILVQKYTGMVDSASHGVALNTKSKKLERKHAVEMSRMSKSDIEATAKSEAKIMLESMLKMQEHERDNGSGVLVAPPAASPAQAAEVQRNNTKLLAARRAEARTKRLGKNNKYGSVAPPINVVAPVATTARAAARAAPSTRSVVVNNKPAPVVAIAPVTPPTKPAAVRQAAPVIATPQVVISKPANVAAPVTIAVPISAATVTPDADAQHIKSRREKDRVQQQQRASAILIEPELTPQYSSNSTIWDGDMWDAPPKTVPAASSSTSTGL